MNRLPLVVLDVLVTALSFRALAYEAVALYIVIHFAGKFW